MSALRWAANYEDGSSITGMLPERLPGDVPRSGMTSLELAQGSPDSGWVTILTVHFAEHERLVFRRRMMSAMFTAASPVAIGLILGTYNTLTDSLAVVYLNGDGTMDLRAATADFAPEPHEVG